jgi:hypothetical protein
MKKIKLAVATLACALMLSSCATTVTLEAAENANDPACAEVIVRLPDVIDVQSKRMTNAQSTGAWGEPAAVILRCGLPEAAASSLTCVTAGGVDWLVDDSQSPSFRFITFGRSPATEVIVDSTAISGVSALEALAPAVENIASTKNCK